MRPTTCLLGTSFLLVLLSNPALAQFNFPAFSQPGFQASGQQLFHREWTSYRGGASHGDGLGPQFNARSCVACHHLGGPGGAGGSEHNVDVLNLIGLRGKVPPSRAAKLEQIVRQIHPGFEGRTSLVLHKESTNPEYATWRKKLLAPQGQRPRSLLAPRQSDEASSAPQRTLKIEGQQFIVTQRNTPALFGAGLVDTISFDGISRLATHQRRENPTLAGQIPVNAGRFGWRGQIATLRDFVAGACANELGLQTVSDVQPIDPLRPDYRNNDIDMDGSQIDALTEFIHQLPAPEQLQPRDRQEAESWRRGEQLFSAAKCSVCHVPKLDTVAGIYSDLLLHDMGASLSDPLPSPRTLAAGESPASSTSASPVSLDYYGASESIAEVLTSSPSRLDTNFNQLETNFSVEEPSSTGREIEVKTQRLWRTPPLWGVRDSAPYMHDGRAATIQEAIEMHDGQGKRSADYFRQLDERSKADLIGFTRSLGVPSGSNHRPAGEASASSLAP